jgi:hypothetical protein
MLAANDVNPGFAGRTLLCWRSVRSLPPPCVIWNRLRSMSCANIPFSYPGSPKNTNHHYADGSAYAACGISDKDNVIFLVGPDGYVGLIASQNWMNSVNEYQKAVACLQHDSVKLRMGTQ